MNWVLLAVLTGLSFGGYNFFTKLGSNKANPFALLFFISLMAMSISLLGSRVLGLSLFGGKDGGGSGILYSLSAGIFYSLGLLLYVVLWRKGISASLGSPVVLSMTALSVSLLGVIFLKEDFSLIRLGGLAVVLVGLYFFIRG